MLQIRILESTPEWPTCLVLYLLAMGNSTLWSESIYAVPQFEAVSYRWLSVQDCSIYIANAPQILQSCTKPSIYSCRFDAVLSLRWCHNEHHGVSNHMRLNVYRPFVQAQIRESLKALRHWPLWRESTGDRWIPLTKGQKRGKCFYWMTPSWYMLYVSRCCQFVA